MTLVLAAVVGLLTVRLAWAALRPTFALPAFEARNYRDRPIPTAVGVLLAVTAVLVEAGRAVADAVGVGERGVTGPRVLVLVAVIGFTLLGVLDDLAGGGDARGFRGHVASLARGRLTTGGLKLVGGGALAVVVCAPRPGAGLARLLADATLVALSANLANLFDRAPGRTLKVGTAAFAALAVGTAGSSVLAPVAVVVGAGAGLLLDDLRERLMLGDAGANALGGVLGLGVVLACAPGTRTVVLVVVAALNLASEVLSFSRVIQAVPPLRAFDGWGRRPE